MVVDQGGMSSVMNIHYEKEELEGELYPHLKGTHSDGLLFCLFDSPVLKLTVLLAWVTLLMSVGFSGSGPGLISRFCPGGMVVGWGVH